MADLDRWRVGGLDGRVFGSLENSRLMEPRDALLQYFGFEEFRGAQEVVIDQIVAGRDGLVVMPTGGGKSLCYQLPALCLEGVTLVVSPLIALMKDQVDALEARGISATMINSTVAWEEQKERLDGMRTGRWKLVYVAPERFRAESFLRALEGVKIALFAVDEAHCLSQWGHDFRPDYWRLGKSLQKLGNPPCVAFTATATQAVREDILQVLQLRDPFETVSGFSRENLSLRITQTEKIAQKEARLKAVIGVHRTGIVYCATRKKVESVSETLASWGVRCVAYHGGMSDGERERVQNQFISGEADVAVATNAFGMGIDRADVRFVIHYELPGSVEAYYQEAGRAGRDGKPAVCELLFNYADTRTQEFFIEGVNPSAEQVRAVYQFLLNQADADYELHLSGDEIAEGAKLKNSMTVGAILTILLKERLIERFDVAGRRTRGTRLLQPNVMTRDLRLDERAMEEKDRRDRLKLKEMTELCYARECRQLWILRYFGEAGGTPCGRCDCCQDGENSTRREPTDEERQTVRKLLSGVARMSSKDPTHGWQGKFGRQRILQMLTGSRAQEILNLGLENLTTYGLLKDKPIAYLQQLFRAMQEARLVVTQQPSDYPLVTLTQLGEEVMRDPNQAFQLQWPSETPAAAPITGLNEGSFDPELFEKLRAIRAVLAKKEKVQAYMIFSNKTLEALVRYRPQTLEQALLLPGVGTISARRFLKPFLQVLQGK